MDLNLFYCCLGVSITEYIISTKQRLLGSLTRHRVLTPVCISCPIAHIKAGRLWEQFGGMQSHFGHGFEVIALQLVLHWNYERQARWRIAWHQTEFPCFCARIMNGHSVVSRVSICLCVSKGRRGDTQHMQNLTSLSSCSEQQWGYLPRSMYAVNDGTILKGMHISDWVQEDLSPEVGLIKREREREYSVGVMVEGVIGNGSCNEMIGVESEKEPG